MDLGSLVIEMFLSSSAHFRVQCEIYEAHYEIILVNEAWQVLLATLGFILCCAVLSCEIGYCRQ